jgi:hypothetical protein
MADEGQIGIAEELQVRLIDALTLYISPGSASKEEISRFFEAMSDYNVAHGGSPLQFGVEGEKIYVRVVE